MLSGRRSDTRSLTSEKPYSHVRHFAMRESYKGGCRRSTSGLDGPVLQMIDAGRVGAPRHQRWNTRRGGDDPPFETFVQGQSAYSRAHNRGRTHRPGLKDDFVDRAVVVLIEMVGPRPIVCVLGGEFPPPGHTLDRWAWDTKRKGGHPRSCNLSGKVSGFGAAKRSVGPKDGDEFHRASRSGYDERDRATGTKRRRRRHVHREITGGIFCFSLAGIAADMLPPATKTCKVSLWMWPGRLASWPFSKQRAIMRVARPRARFPGPPTSIAIRPSTAVRVVCRYGSAHS